MSANLDLAFSCNLCLEITKLLQGRVGLSVLYYFSHKKKTGYSDHLSFVVNHNISLFNTIPV